MKMKMERRNSLGLISPQPAQSSLQPTHRPASNCFPAAHHSRVFLFFSGVWRVGPDHQSLKRAVDSTTMRRPPVSCSFSPVTNRVAPACKCASATTSARPLRPADSPSPGSIKIGVGLPPHHLDGPWSVEELSARTSTVRCESNPAVAYRPLCRRSVTEGGQGCSPETRYHARACNRAWASPWPDKFLVVAPPPPRVRSSPWLTLVTNFLVS
jgi:hypothetical protein